MDKPPTYSEDKEWMWDGNEWIPAPPNVKSKRKKSQHNKGKNFAVAGLILLLLVIISPRLFEMLGDSSEMHTVDTDEDGIPDLDELNIGTDYLDSDSDDDGINDGDEISMGINPLNPDTDNDGVIDGNDVLPAYNFVVEFTWSVRDIEYNEVCHSESEGGGQITQRLRATTTDNPFSDQVITQDGFPEHVMETEYRGNYDVITHSHVFDFPDEFYINSEVWHIPVILSGHYAACGNYQPCYRCIDIGPEGVSWFEVTLVVDKDVDSTYSSTGERECPHYEEKNTPDDCEDDGYNWEGWIGAASIKITAMLL